MSQQGVNVSDVVTANICNSATELLRDILAAFGESYAQAFSRSIERGSRPTVFLRFLKEISQHDTRPTVLLVDEFDHAILLDRDQRSELLNVLRTAFSDGSRRLVCAGFREMMHAHDHMDNPLYNFAEFIRITELKRDEAVEMVLRPLEMLDVTLPSREFAGVLYRETSGHPELLQQACAHIVDIQESGMPVPEAENDLLEAVLRTSRFEQSLISAFLANATPLSELASYLVVKKWLAAGADIRNFEFSLRDINELLHGAGVDCSAYELHSLVGEMELCGLVTQTGAHCRFAIPLLGHALQHLDIDLCIEKAALRYVAES
jgi:hypothetical protein